MTKALGITVGQEGGRAGDRLGISDAVYIYGQAVDLIGNNPVTEGQPDPVLEDAATLFAQALTENAQLTIYLAGPSGPSQPMGSGGPRACAAAVRAYFTAYGYVGTQHPVSNVRVAFTGPDTADSICQIPCYHWLKDGRMLLAPVSYEDQMVKRNGVWKINKRSVFAIRFWVADGYTPDPLDPSLARPTA